MLPIIILLIVLIIIIAFIAFAIKKKQRGEDLGERKDF